MNLRNDYFNIQVDSNTNRLDPPELTDTDPIIVVHSEDELDVLDIPIRLKRALQRGNISTIGEYIHASEKQLYKVRNIGPKSINYLLAYKKKIRLDGIQDTVPEIVPKTDTVTAIKPQPETRTVSEMITVLLSRFKDSRDADVITRRYGLMNGERQTLEEIGESYKLTRERIRQIEKRALAGMRIYCNLHLRKLTNDIGDFIWKHGGLITEEEADRDIEADLNLDGYDGSSVLDLFADLGQVQRYWLKDFLYYSSLRKSELDLERFSDRMLSLLKKHAMGLNLSELASYMKHYFNVNREDFDVRVLIERYCGIDSRICMTDDGKYRLINAGKVKYYESVIKRVLEEEQMPMHFTEITYRTNELLKKGGVSLDERRVYAVLLSSDKFAHTGRRGTYGLTEWGIRKEMLPDLIEEYLVKTGFPLRLEQIYFYVSKYKDTKKMNVVAVLNANKRFQRNSDGSYWVVNPKNNVEQNF